MLRTITLNTKTSTPSTVVEGSLPSLLSSVNIFGSQVSTLLYITSRIESSHASILETLLSYPVDPPCSGDMK